MNTEQAITAAKTGQILRCTESGGRVVEFAYPVPDVWVRIYEEGRGYTCTEASVRNAVTLCDPDVQVIDESESMFDVTDSASSGGGVRVGP